MDPAKQMKVMQEFQKQSAQMDMTVSFHQCIIHSSVDCISFFMCVYIFFIYCGVCLHLQTEMMSDAIDDALDDDEAEDETDELTNQVSLLC